MKWSDVSVSQHRVLASQYCMDKHSKYQGDSNLIILDGWRFDYQIDKWYKWIEEASL